MVSNTTCDNIRRQAIAHLSGETSVLEKQRFARHLEQCGECSTSVARMSEMLEAVRQERFVPSPMTRDEMLEAVLERIVSSRPQTAGLPGPARAHRLGRRLGFALAASVVAAVAGLVLFGKSGERSTSVSPASEPAAAVAPKTVPRQAAPWSLETRRLAEHLALGIAPGTRYASEREGTRHRLVLEQGRLWVSFKKSLEVTDLEIQGAGVLVFVKGTVLVVHAEPGEVMTVGVLNGRVQVVPDVGPAFELSKDEMRAADGTTAALDSRSKEEAAVWLAELVESPEATGDGPSESTSSSPVETGTVSTDKAPRQSELYARAEEKMAEGDYKRAAQLLERLVRSSPSTARADTARLDLAGIYSKHLRQPGRAARHLRAYLERHPSGPKSRLVQQRLLEIEE